MISLEIAELMAQFIFRIFDCRNKCLCLNLQIFSKKCVQSLSVNETWTINLSFLEKSRLEYFWVPTISKEVNFKPAFFFNWSKFLDAKVFSYKV